MGQKHISLFLSIYRLIRHLIYERILKEEKFGLITVGNHSLRQMKEACVNVEALQSQNACVNWF